MGILQSILKVETDDDEEENVISSHQENHPTLFHQTKFLTISTPNLRASSSLDRTTVNGKVRISAPFVKDTAAQPIFPEKCEEKQGPPTIDSRVGPSDGRWIQHYSSTHRILLVGDGDFSFSTSLAAAFGWASNIIATSLDSQVFLVKNYQNALSNLVELSIRKCKVMHEIDATKMANHPFLAQIKFDRIIFNFPFAGFFKVDVPRESQLRRHRELVSKFLMNAKKMVSENGEIHITHKTNGFLGEWKIESIASSHKLVLVEAVDFNHLDYPGYETKYGFGGDNNFNCYPSKTFKFRV